MKPVYQGMTAVMFENGITETAIKCVGFLCVLGKPDTTGIF